MKRRWGAFGAVVAAAIVYPACSPGGSEADEAQKADGSSPAVVSPAASGASTAEARWAKAEFDVEGMSCGGCTLATEAALKKVDGVRSARASLEGEKGGTALVSYDPARTSIQQLVAAIEEIGFRPHLRQTRAP